MKKQLYAAAATAALISTLPQVIQAEEIPTPEQVANMEKPTESVDPAFQAELTTLRQKVMELSTHAATSEKKVTYQGQVGNLAKVTKKEEFMEATGKEFNAFKAEVESDYIEAKNNYTTAAQAVLASEPDRLKQITDLAAMPGTTLMALQDLSAQLYRESEAEKAMGTKPAEDKEMEKEEADPALQAELAPLRQKVMELSEHAARPDKKPAYKQLIEKLAQVNNKEQLKTATGKGFDAFKTEVENDYTEARENYVTAAKIILDPARFEKITKLAAMSGTTLDALKKLSAELYKEHEAEVMGTKPAENKEMEKEEADPTFQAELAPLRQKVMELSEHAARPDKKPAYKQLIEKLAQVNNKEQLKTATEKEFDAFKAEVEKDYAEAKNNLVTAAQSVLASEPDRLKQITDLAEKPETTLKALQDLSARLYKESEEEIKTKKAQEELEAYKKEAINQIAQINDLPQAQKNDFSTQVMAAPTKAEVDTIKEKALNYLQLLKEVEEKKKEAVAEIKTKADLEVDERSNYLDRLEKAGTTSEIESIIAEANETSKRNTAIFEKRKNIQEQVDKLPYLTDDHRSAIRSQLEDEKTDTGLDKIYDQSRKQNVADAKAPHLETLKQTKALIKAVQSLPQLADANLSDAQMKIWAEIGEQAKDFMASFEQLSEETAADTKLTNKIIKDLQELAIFAEIEKIARELEQKRQKFPDNEALKAIMKDMFLHPYGTVSHLPLFIQQEIYPRQKKFNDLYDYLANNQGIGSKTTIKTVRPTEKPDSSEVDSEKAKPKMESDTQVTPAPLPKADGEQSGLSDKPKEKHHYTGQPAFAKPLPKAPENRHFATGQSITSTKQVLPIGELIHSAKPKVESDTQITPSPKTDVGQSGSLDKPKEKHHYTGQPAFVKPLPKAPENRHFATGQPAIATKPVLPLDKLLHSAKPGEKVVKPNMSANSTQALNRMNNSAKLGDKKVQLDTFTTANGHLGQTEQSMKPNQQLEKTPVDSDKKLQQPVELKRVQKTEKATLPKTNEATSLVSLLGIAFAGLAGIFARKRKH
ncbi:GAG-binding domain-containing protein [Streptococcus marmotae]|uniref:GAG-binding domain-containing protein n=1 Tax=Streptococcus marmotae TaxID=1825069 RepID=UPI0008374A84|nr:GAG-binding domain-containing protein [Streptococcus marmotae]